MDPLNEFQQKETEKLSTWFSGIYSTKEARVHTTDLMASSSQRSPVVTETHDLGTTITPHVPVSESKASSIPSGADVDLSDYYTKEEIDNKFEEYYTIEEIDDKFEEYYTKIQIDDILDKYATKEWVEDKIKDFVTKKWAEEIFVKKINIYDEWHTSMWDGENWLELQRMVIRSDLFDCNINNALNSLEIEANCEEGQVTVKLSHPYFSANEC